MKTEVEVAQAYVDRLLLSHVRGELTAVEAAQGKWWITDWQRVVDRPVRSIARWLRLHGGVPDRPRLDDSRIQTIYAGANEVMKEIIGRSLGL